MDQPFYYRSAEVRVPRSAVHVIVCGSVTVVAPGTFVGYDNLERVEIQEGVEEIGYKAFANCPNLARVDCPSSLRTIDGWAFAWCKRLLELNLAEGLRRIGSNMFYECGMERVAVPSSVVEIGVRAFAYCRQLSEVTLAGGMVLLPRGAFFGCPRLEKIAISSMSIVVEAGEDGNGRVSDLTGRIEPYPANESPRLIMTSPHLASMRPEELTNLTDAIDRIAATTHGAGPLDLADGDVSSRIRHGFIDHLSTWYKREAATILELGLWKIELGRAREAIWSRAAGGKDTAGVNLPIRDASRLTCGADPIVGLVLSSLAGPHRPVYQS